MADLEQAKVGEPVQEVCARACLQVLCQTAQLLQSP
jgi:hypothetical protein